MEAFITVIRFWHLHGGTGGIYCWQLQDIYENVGKLETVVTFL